MLLMLLILLLLPPLLLLLLVLRRLFRMAGGSMTARVRGKVRLVGLGVLLSGSPPRCQVPGARTSKLQVQCQAPLVQMPRPLLPGSRARLRVWTWT